MNTNAASQKRVAITISAENAKSLRLLAALQSRSQKDLADEVFVKSDIKKWIEAELLRANQSPESPNSESENTGDLNQAAYVYMPEVTPVSTSQSEGFAVSNSRETDSEGEKKTPESDYRKHWMPE